MIRATLSIALAGMLLASCTLPGLDGDSITVTVVNNRDENATLEITESQIQNPGGARTIAVPIVVPPGEHQVRLVSPEAQWSLQLRGVEGYFDSQDLHVWQERGSLRMIIEVGGMTAEIGPP